jgi:hypothetical protein
MATGSLRRINTRVPTLLERNKGSRLKSIIVDLKT